ncbi:MAG: GTPase [Pseudomonadota bacterium]
MQVGSVLKTVLVVLVTLTLLALLTLLLSLTDATLSMWERLQSAAPLIRYGFVALIIALLVAFSILVFRILKPAKKREIEPAVVDETGIRERLADVASAGVDTKAADAVLQTLDSHRAGDALSIALFGAVSTGKSSLARALLPDAEVAISPVAGSTVEVARYQWRAKTGAVISIADLPGLEAVGKAIDEEMLDEARSAHAVVFVTDGDLSRQQVDALTTLRRLGKPLIVTLNKADRFRDDERKTVLLRMRERLDATDNADGPAATLIVTIAGGEQAFTVREADGREHASTRQRAADISQLVLALEELLGSDLSTINALRERSLLTLAADKLASAEASYRAQRATQIIQTATRRAVVGALAAVTPGTDVVIQGYLATQMTRSLCKLYGQEPRELEVERFLDLSQSRVGKAVPLSLAIAGNGLKAFPGIGTIAGGLVHAVAYGLIFDAVGRGLAKSLEQEGVFDAGIAASSVEKGLNEHLEQNVRRVARMALEYRGSGKSPD